MGRGFRSFVLSACISAAFSSPMVMADDATAEGLLDQAKEVFLDRDQPGKADELIELLTQAQAQVESQDLKYDILILSSRAYYWKGVFTEDTNTKKALFDQSRNQAQVARDLDPKYAEGFYFYAIALGRWAEVNGIWESIWRKAELMDNAEKARKLETRDSDLGDAIDGYGPDRALGRVHYKLKDVPGHSLQQALMHFKRAYENAPRYVINIVFYAEALAKGDGSQRAIAKQLLDSVLAQDPETFNTDRLVETRYEFTLAREARKQMGD